MKPTYGGSSRYGLVAFASSLDTPGPLARTVLDAALLHEAISGHDPCDSTSVDAPVPPVVAAARQPDVSGLRIGVVAEFSGDGYQSGVQARFNEAVELLESLGAKVVEVSCPHFTYALPAYYLIAPSECSSNLARFDGMRYGLRAGDDGSRSADEVMSLTRAAGFGAEVKRRIMLGTYALSSGYYDAYYGKAQQVRTLHLPGLRRGVRAGGRAGLPDYPDDSVSHRGTGRRPDGDVPGGPVHDPVRSGRERGHLRPLRPCPRGRAAGRAPDHGAGPG